MAGCVAVGAWFMKGRPADPAPAPGAESQEAPQVAEAEPTTAESAPEATADAPEPAGEPVGAWPSAEESAPSEAPSPEPAEGPRPPAEATADAADRGSEAVRDVSPGPSDFDALAAKSEIWRERYRPVKAEVERLEAEVAKLERDTKNSYVAGNATGWVGGQLVYKVPDPTSPIRSSVERNLERLPVARRELANAKAALAAIEEAARRDGVASGQLY